MSEIIIKDFKSYQETIEEVLSEIKLAEEIKKEKQILIKPNLTANLPFPVTTPKELVEEVLKFCLKNSRAKIVIAEGSGGCDTQKAFENLGYLELRKKYPVEILDLNRAERIEKEDPKALKLKKVLLPKIAFESYIINLPVLKVHLEAKMTAALKNIFGFYLNQKWLKKRVFPEGWWNKSELHRLGVNESIVDLNNYIKFNFNLVDASLGQLGSEIEGYPCQPAIGKIIAGFDPREVDLVSAPFLGLKKEEINYLWLQKK